MSCFHPIKVQDQKTGLDVHVPCGKCVGCLAKKRSDWSFRLNVEHKHADLTILFTLTYSDKNVPVKILSHSPPLVTDHVVRRGDVSSPSNYVNIVNKRDIQTFIKRFRFNNPYWSIRYFVTAEYGPTTLRPHYHGLFFVKKSQDYGAENNCSSKKNLSNKVFSITSVGTAIERAWSIDGSPLGFVSFRSPTSDDLAYTAKYVTKEMDKQTPTPTWQVMSKRPFLGYQFVNNRSFDKAKSEYYNNGGYLTIDGKPLPRIYQRKFIPSLYSSAFALEHERYQQIMPLIYDILDSGDYTLYSYLPAREREYVDSILNDAEKLLKIKKRREYEKSAYLKEQRMLKSLRNYWKNKTEQKEKILFNK